MNSNHNRSNKLFEYVSTLSVHTQLYILSVLFLSTVAIIPSNKIFLLACGIFTLILFYILRNAFHTILYAYILFLPFQNGKGLNFLVVPAEFVYGNIPFIMSVNFTISNLLSAILLYAYFRKYIFIQTAKPRTSEIFLLLFICTLFISSMLSNIPWLSFLLSIQLSSYSLMFYVLQSTNIQHWIHEHITPLLASLCTIEGIWSILQVINKGPFGLLHPAPADNLIHKASEDSSFIRMQGTFSHPNFLGMFTATVCPILLYQSLSKHNSNAVRLMSAVGFAFGLTGLMLSGSRASWIALLVTVVVILHNSRIRNNISFTGIVKRLYTWLIIIACVVSPFVLLPRISQFVITFGPDGGSNFRIDLLRKSLLTASLYPFGIGLGTFPQVLLEEIGGFTSSPTQPHNLFAQILVAGGYLGIISFIGFLFSHAFRIFTSSVKMDLPEQSQRFVLIISLTSWISLSTLYPILTEQEIFSWFWILLALIV